MPSSSTKATRSIRALLPTAADAEPPNACPTDPMSAIVTSRFAAQPEQAQAAPLLRG
jgi:hypothetical protein